MTNVPRFAFALTLLAALSACGDQGENEGRSILERIQVSGDGPDEFKVVRRRPLEEPPDLTALPPPTPGAPSRVEPRPEETTTALLSGGGGPVEPAGQSAGELAILALVADPDLNGIRERVAADHAERVANAQDSLPALLTGRPLFDPYEEDWLNAEEEVLRLRETYPGAQIPVPPAPPEDG